MKDWAVLRGLHDAGDMFARIHALPEQIGEAASGFRPLGKGPDGAGARAVLLLGMGGSAIGGEIVRAVLGPVAALPVEVVRGFEVPAWCGASTLVIATSYSGNTEETVAAAVAARARGARIAVIASGGQLAARAEEWGAPLAKIPGGLPPRTAIGHLTVSTLLFLERAGLTPPWTEALAETEKCLQTLRRAWNLEDGPADGEPAEAAVALEGTMPFVYCGGGEMAPVAMRWCGQLAENAKTLGRAAMFPEANHNEIVGWERMAGLPRVGLVVLRSPADPERVERGMEVALGLVADRAARVVRHGVKGASPLARIFAGVYFADWVSYFLALVYGIDPTPVRSIDVLKRALAEERP